MYVRGFSGLHLSCHWSHLITAAAGYTWSGIFGLIAGAVLGIAKSHRRRSRYELSTFLHDSVAPSNGCSPGSAGSPGNTSHYGSIGDKSNSGTGGSSRDFRFACPRWPFIHPRAAEPTRLCSSHHRPGKNAVIPARADVSRAVGPCFQGIPSTPVGGELLLSPQSVEIIKFGDPGSGR